MLVRKNIRMSEEVATWYEEKAKSLGVSQANLMIIALSQYIDQQKSIDMMPKFEELLERLKSPE